MAMHLTDEGLINKKEWEEHGVRLPEYDRAAMRRKTLEAPVWVHFAVRPNGNRRKIVFDVK